MISLKNALLFYVPLVVSLLITPLVIRLAERLGAMDQPEGRKVHKAPVPRLGGVAIYVAFLVGLLALMLMNPEFNMLSEDGHQNGIMLVISLTIVLALGIWDDIYPLTPGRKFCVQLFAATIVYLAGFRITLLSDPTGDGALYLGLLGYPLTVFWIVGITNAFNLIDGLDGLAGGVGVIAAVTIGTISYVRGDVATSLTAFLLAGALIGFLRYNFMNARIFLGDSGSLFLGFSLAILSIQGSTKGTTAISILVPLLALGLPIMDTGLSMVRRFLRSILPDNQNPSTLRGKLSSIFHPDKGHVHHQLIAKGFSHRRAVILLYVVSCIFGAGAVAVSMSSSVNATLIVGAIAVATVIGISQLQYREMSILRNGLLLPVYQWPILASNTFLSFLDLGFMLVAYHAAFFLSVKANPFMGELNPHLQSVASITGIQLLVFYVTGMYKTGFHQLGFGDILHIARSVILSIASMLAALALFELDPRILDPTFVVLNFFILLTLVFASRGSFNVIHYFFRREKNVQGRKVLIYGADARGLLMVQGFMQDPSARFCPVGFLDDNPRLEGKRLDGYPIFGGHWKLARLLNTHKIQSLIVSTDSMNPGIYERLYRLCRSRNVELMRASTQFEPYVPVLPAPNNRSLGSLGNLDEMPSAGQQSFRFIPPAEGQTQVRRPEDPTA